MDWKKENIRNRHIDSVTKEEVYKIAYLALGMPRDFRVLTYKVYVDDNNYPHLGIKTEHYEPVIGEDIEMFVGVMYNLNVYTGSYDSVYCQKKLFEYFKEIGLE